MNQSFDPAEPDGKNASTEIAVSTDGTPVPGQRYRITPRCGIAVRLNTGQYLSVENTHGTQVCDFWAFADADGNEYLSMEHTHTTLNSISPKVNDPLVSNRRRALLSVIEDSSLGVHDTVIASCDHQRYQQLGCSEYHDNCADNLRMAMIAIGRRAPIVPAPFNLWMNIPVAPDGKIQWFAPVLKPADTMMFRAELDVIVIMSACPQDMTPVNGEDCEPTELHFSVR